MGLMHGLPMHHIVYGQGLTQVQVQSGVGPHY